MPVPQRWLNTLLVAAVCIATVDGPVTARAQNGGATAQEIDRLLAEATQDQIVGRIAEMERAASTALAASRALGDRLRTARSLMSLGVALFSESRVNDALALLREGEPIAAELGDRNLQARFLNGMGVDLRELGDYEGAADYMGRALSMQRALGNRLEQSRILRNVAALNLMLGNFAYGEERAQEAYALATEAREPLYQKVALETLGNLQRSGGDPALAARTLTRAVAISLATPAPQVDMEILVGLGYTEMVAGQNEAAFATARRVIEMEAAAPSALMRAGACQVAGAALFRLHRLDESLEWLLRSRATFRTFAANVYPAVVIETELWIARVLHAKGQVADALTLDLDLMKSVERYLVGTHVNDVSRATAVSTTSEVFVETIDVLFSLGRIQEAFDVSERYRARAFLESLIESRNSAVQGLSVDQKRLEDNLATRAGAAQKELWDADLPAARRAGLEQTLGEIDDAFDAVRREVRRDNPKYAEIRYPELTSAAQTMASLPPDTTLLSFVLGDDHSFVWAISTRGVASAWLPGRATIEPRVAAYRRLLTTRPPLAESEQRRTAIEQAGQALYRTLISPIEDNLKNTKHLIIAPDGALQVLPFEALIRAASRQTAAGSGAASSSEPRWLVRDFSISETPSVSALAAIAAGASAEPRSRALLAFGDPVYPATLGRQQDIGSKAAPVQERGMRLTALPSTRIEVNSIAALYPPAAVRVYLGKDAREEAVKAEALDQYRYLHFAAHASIDDTRPDRSGIVLSIDPASREDGMLRADEVMALHLNADLVTLSACSTGLGKVLRGEGIVGLTRAFFLAGARSVAASLWNVNDEATAALMVSFYGGLNRGLTRDDALRNAKLSLIGASDRRLRDPYYWAPFVLMGLAK